MLKFVLHALLIWQSTFAYNDAAERIQITDIQATFDRNVVEFSSNIHSNGTKFDIFLTLHQPLQKHDLSMNMKLKGKWNDDTNYRLIFQWKRIDVCKCLKNYNNNALSKFFFKQAPVVSSSLNCPLKKGDYEMLNFELEQNGLSDTLKTGSYRVFVEVAQASADVVKLFNMQITLNYYGNN